ncbi:hypothetical protein H6P81_015355 [Aristolochia fimbriata]|uniref:RRM domain-containing protein n=1 Tax=Aristolochia fimbriata TaxID=158543 RepID=A0AAV7E550_ARIFI|nr:hypothetical protein H6P81_015355 [Aristolochia fimbriata]
MEGSSSRGPRPSASEQEYAKFLEKVSRTLYIDNLGFRVTKAMIRSGLDQFGKVVGVEILPEDNLSTSLCVLVEMATEKDAESVIEAARELPLLIGGMPRPVRVLPAEPEMFEDRPVPPGQKIEFRWVYPGEPEFVSGGAYKEILDRHEREAEMLMQLQQEEELKLLRKQNQSLRDIVKTHDTLESAKRETKKLADAYGLKFDWKTLGSDPGSDARRKSL